MKKLAVVFAVASLVLLGCASPSEAEQGPTRNYVVWTELVPVDGRTIPCIIVDSKYDTSKVGYAISCNWNRG